MRFAPLSAVRLTGGPLRAAQDTGRRYLMAFEPDRLLAPFLREAGLAPRAEAYGNWESSGLDGHIGGHYLSALALLVASTGDREARDRLAYMVAELARAQEHLGTGYVGGVPRGVELWEEVASGISADTFSRDGRWVPWYNLHKTYAGLLDAHRHAGTPGALDVLLRLAAWWEAIAAGIDDEQFPLMLATEFGGMNDVYAELYEQTGDERHLDMASRFTRRVLLDPLAEHVDSLTGLHANTQIPQIVGFARSSVATEDERLADAARFFWETVVERRSVSIGGNSVREHFHDADDFAAMVEDREGPETCNTYNMVKLSGELFLASDDTRYLDFVERAQLNHLLSSQHPEHGGLVYFTPMRPGHYRVYSTVEDCQWCCVGTGLETHAKHGGMLYAFGHDTLSVLQFAPSTVEWPQRGVLLTQETDFPVAGATRLTLRLDGIQEFSLRIRRPAWVASEPVVRVNGSPFAVERDGGHLVVRRAWADGDAVEVELPMAIAVDELPDGSDWVAFRFGPIVLGARVSAMDDAELLADSARMGHIAFGPLTPLAGAPVLRPADVSGLRPDVGGPLTFRLPTSQGEVVLEPFAGLHDARYSVYFPWAPDGDLERRRTDLRERDERALALDGRTVDVVALGEQQPESDHGFTGEGLDRGVVGDVHWRSTDDRFGLALRDVDGVGIGLRIVALTSPRSAHFAVDVDGEQAHVVHLSELPTATDTRVVIEIPIPAQTPGRGVRHVRVRVLPGSWSGRIAEMRLLS